MGTQIYFKKGRYKVVATGGRGGGYFAGTLQSDLFLISQRGFKEILRTFGGTLQSDKNYPHISYFAMEQASFRTKRVRCEMMGSLTSFLVGSVPKATVKFETCAYKKSKHTNNQRKILSILKSKICL